MKKAIAFLLCMLMVISCCACGNTNSEVAVTQAAVMDEPEETKVKVVTNNGNTEYLTLSELREIENANKVAYKKEYYCAQATLTGKVEEINSGSTLDIQWEIVVDGWTVYEFSSSLTGYHPNDDFIASLKIGDTVEVNSELRYPGEIGSNSDKMHLTKY